MKEQQQQLRTRANTRKEEKGASTCATNILRQKLTMMFVSRRPLTSRIYESASNRRRRKNDHLSNAPIVGCAVRTVCDTRSNFSVIAFYFPTLCARTTEHSTCNRRIACCFFSHAISFATSISFIRSFMGESNMQS